MEPIEFPFYVVLRGKRRGDIRKFEFVTLEEFARLGRNKCVELEWNRFRAVMISADPELKAKWSQRRTWRRNNEPGLREKEVEQERSRKASDEKPVETGNNRSEVKLFS
jgi:hypothetical protein